MSDDYRLNTNPHSFLSGNSGVQIGEVPYQQALAIPNWVQKNGDLWNYRSDVYFTLGYVATPVKKISPNYSALRSPVAFLPYYPDTVCFMCIPDNVDAFWTSQLTGCNVYVCTAADHAVWVFHANYNSETSATENTNKKRALAERARKTMGGTSWDLALERGITPGYPAGNAAGIFFGQRVARGSSWAWGFYLYTPSDGLVSHLASSVTGTNASL